MTAAVFPPGGAVSDGGAGLSAVRQIVTHPQLDAALLQVAAASQDVAPIGQFTGDPNAYVGATAQIAGYGFTDTGTAGDLRFAVETVVGVSPAIVTGRGVSGSGACVGDSGGPMIVRDDTGAPTVLGLLSNGSAACNQTDEYLRSDVLVDWVTQTVGATQPDDGSCGGIGVEGRCFSGVAVWCDTAGLRKAERCGASTPCGWSTSQQGYRCVANDPCGGIDGFGVCDGMGVVRRCEGGVLTTTSCGCGMGCRLSGASAMAGCVEQ